MAETTPANVVMLDRSVYDNKVHAGTIDNSTIYFVREGSPALSKMMSLYVGPAKQCDLMDITDDLVLDPETNEYIIPQSHRIPNKLLFYKQTLVTDSPDPQDPSYEYTYDYYRISMWDDTKQKFLDCNGFPNNVIVITQGVLPDSNDAVKNFTYIDIMNRSIYVFDGNSYIPIIDLSQYATKEWVQDYHDSHPTPVNVDDITILKGTIGGVPDVLHGAGADVSGKTYTIDGSSVTAFSGAHVFNDYSGNKATKPYSSVFGKNNTESYTGTIENYWGCNLISGLGNSVKGADYSVVSGYNANVSFTGRGLRAYSFGSRNSITGQGTYDFSYGPISSIFGVYNRLTLTDGNTGSSSGDVSFISGNDNQVSIGASMHCSVFGYQNSFSATTVSYSPKQELHTFIAGSSNSITNTYGCTVLGYWNRVTTSSDLGKHVGMSILGSQNQFECDGGEGVSIVGHQNRAGGSLPNTAISHSTVHGSNNLLSGSAQGIGYCDIIGSNNIIQVPENATESISYCQMLGDALYTSWSNCTIIGMSNTKTLPTLPSGTTARVIIGTGNGLADNQRRNMAIITSDNEMLCYGDVTDSGTDMSLKTSFRTVTVTPSSGAVTLANLPRNGDETILSYDMGDSNNPVSLTSITISDLSVPIMGTATDVGLDVANGEVDDYCATIAFRPNAQTPISDVTTLLTNFNPTGQEPRIYLMNPDIDVSTYTVIHLLLFYDGFNVCCTVAGYEEVPSV